MDLYVLFEHAAGYALFRVKEFEDIGALLPQVEASVTDLSKFNSVVKLVGFAPFKTALVALESINSISEGVLPEDLNLFLETYLPKSTKKGKITLGVIEPKLAAAITEALGTKCLHTGVVPEIVRGIRAHFHQLVKGFTLETSGKAQLGLGHSYSRAKVKFNVNRVDNMIIQSIALLDQMDKDVNTFAMRIREWYSYHFPELVKIVPDNYMYARVAQYIKNRKELSEENLPGLEELVQDESKAQAILGAARSSMGMDISPVDLINIEMFAKRVVALADYRKSLSHYLNSKMESVAPNLATLIGDQVGARLISHAGSLTNLAKYPASTLQILGAEKALFRALRTRSNTPKYGLLFHSSFIGRAGPKDKGRISRYIANKCSIAARLDCFADIPTNVFGEKLKQQVEDRLTFLKGGDKPPTNISVMEDALAEAAVQADKKRKKKKKKKSKVNGVNGDAQPAEEEEEPAKKKKKSLVAENNGDEVETNGESSPRKKKKKKKSKAADDDE
ncbi:nucleolar protein 56 [Neocloeon triangulifer]|uniref:nucleolar protein 56 n=1 Tax=Neocloeon triangulifer TaxID=2078957 RepID=UPI00286F8D52|nr:nucleolar protein 56 [Neocloeon triangulifer]XP_059477449.1 nucleolar protein 56 [Neocloeon triangulifer]